MPIKNTTNQTLTTQGGNSTFTLYSGTAGGDALIVAGAGRLDSVVFNQGSMLALSGQSVLFYDAAVAVSGGPIAASGHKIVGAIGVGAPDKVAASGDMFVVTGQPTPVGYVFTSGLCYNSRSGQMGWSCSFTTA